MATASGTITQWSGRVSKSWLPSSSSFSSTSSTPTSDASLAVLEFLLQAQALVMPILVV